MQLGEDADYIFMHENFSTFLLHIKKLIAQIVFSHPVATGRLFALCVVCFAYH